MTTTPHSSFYVAHLHSERWATFRREMIEAAGYRCEKCRDLKPLDVHHIHYFTLGRERPADVQVLCRDCHECADEERREANWQRRVEGFARKKYGFRWESLVDFDDVSEELADYLDRKRAA